MSFLQYFGLPAAGAGAAGAAGAAGLSAASALNPVSAGIMAAAPLASGIYGIVQKAQADKLRKQFDQPMYAIPQGMQEAYGLAQSRAFDTSLPGQSLIEAGIDRGQAAANRAIMESGLSGAERLAAINAGAGNRMDANTQLAMQMAQQQQQNLANYQNTLGQLAGYQEKQWQLNKQQPWIDAMEAANRLSEAGSQNIMTGLKDLSGIGVAMAKQGIPNAQIPTGVTPMETRTPSLMTQPSISRTPDQYTIEQALGTTNLPIEGTGQDLIGQAFGYSIANRNASQGAPTPPAVNTTQNIATTPPAVNTDQNVVTTQPTTTATEAVTPAIATNQNLLPAGLVEKSAYPQYNMTGLAPNEVPETNLPGIYTPPTLQSFMENVPMAMPTNISGNMASPFSMQPNYSVQDQYGFMLPTQQVATQARPVLTEPSPMINPINPDFAAMGLPTTNTISKMEFKPFAPTEQNANPELPQGLIEKTKGSKTGVLSSFPTTTQFQNAGAKDKLDFLSQNFGQFGLKGK
jgi:hypothetical protein